MCSQLQGYLFSRPISTDQLAAWVKALTPSEAAPRIVA
jgi:EAL domain-containing protein (putative c-di-GMP-specific phosphodiesterase class I)